MPRQNAAAAGNHAGNAFKNVWQASGVKWNESCGRPQRIFWNSEDPEKPLILYINRLNIQEHGQINIRQGRRFTALICLICAMLIPKTNVSRPPTATKSFSISGVVRGIMNCAE